MHSGVSGMKKTILKLYNCKNYKAMSCLYWFREKRIYRDAMCEECKKRYDKENLK